MEKFMFKKFIFFSRYAVCYFLDLREGLPNFRCLWDIFALLDPDSQAQLNSDLQQKEKVKSSVADPWHFGVDPDPDPRIHASD